MDNTWDARFFSSSMKVPRCAKHVLPIPGFNSGFIPNLPSNSVITGITAVVKPFLPPLGPLTIHVMLPPLARACRREDDRVGMCHESVQQLICMDSIEVFRNLEAYHGIKPPTQVPRLRKVLLRKKCSGHKQGAFRHRNTVHAEDVIDPGIKCSL